MKLNKRIKNFFEKGFGFVELAIALVAVGVISTGVYTSTNLGDSAKRQMTISTLEKYQSAYNQFKAKYDGLPGDLNNATTYFTGTVNGNGNTTIEQPSGTGDQEHLRAWQHLTLAGALRGNYSGFKTVTPTTPLVAGTDVPGGYFPKSKYLLYNSIFIYDRVSVPSVHLGVTSTTAGGTFSGGALFPENNLFIDQKIDDGAPKTGGLMGISATGSVLDTSCVIGEDYNVAQKSNNCVLVYRLEDVSDSLGSVVACEGSGLLNCCADPENYEYVAETQTCVHRFSAAGCPSVDQENYPACTWKMCPPNFHASPTYQTDGTCIRDSQSFCDKCRLAPNTPCLNAFPCLVGSIYPACAGSPLFNTYRGPDDPLSPNSGNICYYNPICPTSQGTQAGVNHTCTCRSGYVQTSTTNTINPSTNTTTLTCALCPAHSTRGSNGKCGCASGYIVQSLGSGLNNSAIVCVSDNCGANSVQNTSGQCVCTTGYHANPQPPSTPNYVGCIPCTAGTVWTQYNNVYDCHRHSCIAGYYWDNTYESNGDYHCVPNPVCNDSTFVVSSTSHTCVCPSTKILSGGTCVACTAPKVANTATNTCICPTTMITLNDGTCQACDTANHYVANKTTNTCVCATNYELHGGVCISTVCSPTQTFNHTTGLCACKVAGYIPDNGNNCVLRYPAVCPSGQTAGPSGCTTTQCSATQAAYVAQWLTTHPNPTPDELLEYQGFLHGAWEYHAATVGQTAYCSFEGKFEKCPDPARTFPNCN